MFRKENSSCSIIKKSNDGEVAASSNNKKNAGKKYNSKKAAASSAPATNVAVDVPLRKSDIRHLRQRVKDFFSIVDHSGSGAGGSIISTAPPNADAVEPEEVNSNSDELQKQQQQEQQQQQRDERLSAVLDKVFLPGNIATRQLHHPELGKLTLYVRLPHVAADLLKAAAAAADSTTESEFYWPYGAPQVIWISQPPMPNTSQVEVAMPTLALLSVLWFLPATTGESTAAAILVMPTVYVPSSASKFLCRGAHLMRAGMMNLPSFNATTAPTSPPSSTHAALLAKADIPRVVAIAVAGNPQPMAVGVIDPGVGSAADVGIGTKGVGAYVWSCYGDDLWQQQVLEMGKLVTGTPPAITSEGGGGNFNDGHYGNVGFLEGQQVVPISSDDDEDYEEEDDDEQPESAWDANEPPELKDDKDQADENSNDAAAENSDQEAPTQLLEAEKEEVEKEVEEEDEEPLSQDDLLHQAVCQALLTSVSPADLPMTVANFYANHVLPSRPANTTIQLKQTKYKKFGNYLQEKVERNLITLGPGPKGKSNSQDKNGYLVAFDKRHQILLAYKHECSEQFEQAKETKNAAVASAKNKLVLVNLHVVPHHFISPLRLDPEAVKGTNASSPERAGTGMLTMPELRKLLEEYLERENLVDYDQVELDGPLFDVLYKKKKKGGEVVSNDTLTLSRKEVADLWVAAMEPAYALVQMPGSKVLKLGRGKPPKVQIEVSMRQSRKFITKLRGMESYGVNGQVLAKDIGRRLACQATVDTEAEKGVALAKGCVEIVLGGNFAGELEALLLGDEKLCPGHGGLKSSDYSLPKNSVEIVLRKGVPARKRMKKAGGKK